MWPLFSFDRYRFSGRTWSPPWKCMTRTSWTPRTTTSSPTRGGRSGRRASRFPSAPSPSRSLSPGRTKDKTLWARKSPLIPRCPWVEIQERLLTLIGQQAAILKACFLQSHCFISVWHSQIVWYPAKLEKSGKIKRVAAEIIKVYIWIFAAGGPNPDPHQM